MATIKQIEANRRNAQLSTGPTSEAGKAVTRMNALKTGIDAQSEIITGEDPEALERLTTQYYERFQPQGPEEVALIDAAISSDWLLRRFRKTEAQTWDRSTTQHAADLRKWGQKAEEYSLAAAFRDQQKVFERLQRRISAAERSLRASLETLARLRKQLTSAVAGPAISSPANPDEGQSPSAVPVAPAVSAASKTHPQPPASSPISPSKENVLPEIGFDPEIYPAASPEPAPPPPPGA
jgi:hypothetical protein